MGEMNDKEKKAMSEYIAMTCEINHKLAVAGKILSSAISTMDACAICFFAEFAIGAFSNAIYGILSGFSAFIAIIALICKKSSLVRWRKESLEDAETKIKKKYGVDLGDSETEFIEL